MLLSDYRNENPFCFFLECMLLQQWGYQMKYKKSVLLANVKIKSFALDTPDGRTTVKQWKNVPFVVEDFNFLKYCNGLPGDPMD
jgi:hypothetical protein